MLTSNQYINSQILNLAEDFICRWLKPNKKTYFELLKRDILVENRIKWNNPENIETGLSGVVILIIETFKKNRKREYLILAESIVTELIEFSKANTTNNYSLFTGRCGVVYIILQLYKLNNDKSLLSAALEIIKAAPPTFLNSDYVNETLYDGKAGTLLMLFSLYACTEDQSLLEDIILFTNKIISNASIFSKGIYWENTEEIFHNPLHGFATGDSGIGYVFYRLKELFQADVYQFLKAKMSFTDEWDFPTTDEDSLSWACGKTGYEFCKLFTLDLRRTHLTKLHEEINQMLIKHDIEKLTNYNLYGGLAGIGCFCIAASKNYPNGDYFQLAGRIADKILKAHSNKSYIYDGLFVGDIGCLYFLLQTITTVDDAEYLLCPTTPNITRKTNLGVKIPLTILNIRRVLLERYYFRTIFLVERIAPEFYTNFFLNSRDNQNEDELLQFTSSISAFINSNNSIVNLCIHDLYELEQNKYQFGRMHLRNNIYLDREETERHTKIMNVIKYRDEDFLNIVLKRSTKVKVISLRWEWTELAYDKKNNELFKNIHLQTQEHIETMLRLSSNCIVEEKLDLIGSFCWHWFKTNSSVQEALNNLMLVCKPLAEGNPENTFTHFDRNDAIEYYKRLHYNFIYKIKEFMYSGVLLVTK